VTARGTVSPGAGADMLARLAALAEASTEVGIQGEGGGPAPDHQPDGTPMGTLMARHEFGAGVPARPVLGPATAAARADLERAAGEAVSAALASGPAAASAVLGPILERAMVERISSGVDPPLEDPPGDAPGERGPTDTPLVASGQLRGAIRWAHRGPA
jgi:hypothetical protein